MSGIILASASPRRSQLLKMCNLNFETIKPEADETVEENISADKAVVQLAERKATNVMNKVDNNKIVIAADTVVSLENNILTKPTSREDSYRMLHMLSGKVHQVYTGVCLGKNERILKSFYCKTDVKFYKLCKEEILSYIATGEADDKAGAYAIQGMGAIFVEKITGDYYNVVGLPIASLVREIKKLEARS